VAPVTPVVPVPELEKMPVYELFRRSRFDMLLMSVLPVGTSQRTKLMSELVVGIAGYDITFVGERFQS
jgi:hypothetical protein